MIFFANLQMAPRTCSDSAYFAPSRFETSNPVAFGSGRPTVTPVGRTSTITCSESCPSTPPPVHSSSTQSGGTLRTYNPPLPSPLDIPPNALRLDVPPPRYQFTPPLTPASRHLPRGLRCIASSTPPQNTPCSTLAERERSRQPCPDRPSTDYRTSPTPWLVSRLLLRRHAAEGLR